MKYKPLENNRLYGTLFINEYILTSFVISMVLYIVQQLMGRLIPVDAITENMFQARTVATWTYKYPVYKR